MTLGKITTQFVKLLLCFFLGAGFVFCLIIITMIGLNSSIGQILFTQNRLGQHGRIFRIYKLKTMRELRDEQGNLLPDAERITKLGHWLRKTSLDELPQIINILKGDMNLIGPRPLLPEYLDRFNARQKRRLEVKPGLTGWAQVKGRNALTWEERLELDIWYLEHRSWQLDLKILWLSFYKVFVHGDGHIASEEFLGSDSSKSSV